eukprot:366617-Prorocentrum_minimum.AAC.2
MTFRGIAAPSTHRREMHITSVTLAPRSTGLAQGKRKLHEYAEGLRSGLHVACAGWHGGTVDVSRSFVTMVESHIASWQALRGEGVDWLGWPSGSHLRLSMSNPQRSL